MSVSQRPAGDWPLLPRRPLTPVETVPLQVAAGSLWKHLGPAWVIGHMGDSAIQETPAVPGMLLEAGSMAAYPNSHILVISSRSISTVCSNTTTCCNMQYTKSGLRITDIQTHIQCMHTHTCVEFIWNIKCVLQLLFLLIKFVQLLLKLIIKWWMNTDSGLLYASHDHNLHNLQLWALPLINKENMKTHSVF